MMGFNSDDVQGVIYDCLALANAAEALLDRQLANFGDRSGAIGSAKTVICFLEEHLRKAAQLADEA